MRYVAVTPVVILILLTFPSCGFNAAKDLEIKQNEYVDNPYISLGYGEVDKLEIVRYSYSAVNNLRSKNVVMMLDTREREFIRSFVDVLNSKVPLTEETEILPAKYRVVIMNKSNESEEYDFAYNENVIIFMNYDGTIYIVDDEESAAVYKFLLEEYYPKKRNN